MKVERWRQVDELIEAALDREPVDRAGFLREVCGSDEELRHEVESLLAAHEKAGSFIETPPIDDAAQAIAAKQRHLAIGECFGHYRVLSRIGKGGMGEVYLAQDIKLGRKVAIKLLPSSLDEDRVRRFQLEARAASALNHPNILTIYEVGEDSLHFIATEYIEGKTLRQQMGMSKISVSEALEVATQIANALAAAHQAGIVHRDIKPENVMRRPDGYVKVLDFGLAKLTEPQSGFTVSQLPTAQEVQTAPGLMMGTVSYMSPEQARAQSVDERTDIFSLGVVTYEMITGHAPFEGETLNHIVVAILEKEPAPLARYCPEAPAELQRILTKALRKNRDERYQTVKDFALDLKRLKQALEQAESSGSTLPAAKLHRSTLTRRLMVASGIALVALAALLVWLDAGGLRGRISGKANSARIDSVAIMPLANADQDPDTDYLADGITESIINNLSQLSKLRVMSRSSVLRYKGKEVDPQKVGAELNVKAVVVGRIVPRGDNVSISLEMVAVTDNHQVWGQRYERKMSDLLQLQAEVSQDISSKLRLTISGDEQKLVTKRQTENNEAYQLYLRGRFWEDRRSEEGFKKAIEYFNKAIEKDPNYALAYVGLSGTYGGLSDHGFLSTKEGFTRAKDAVMKALALDDQLAEAHTELAADMCFYDWNFGGAEPEYKRAIELNPNIASAHYLYGSYLSIVGRHDEAIAEKRRAQELEPSSVIDNFGIGWALCRAGQYDQAIETLLQTVEMDRTFGHTFRFLGLAYLQKGMYDEAINYLLEAVRLDPTHTGFMASLGCAYGRSGRRSETLRLLERLTELSRRRYVASYDLAMIYASLGDNAQAFAHLEKAFKERSNQLAYLRGEPAWDSLRFDPQFISLLRRIGLTQ